MVSVILFTIWNALKNFVWRWYVKGSLDFWAEIISFFARLDRFLGVGINVRLLFKPLFSDYSFIGKLIGPMFRLTRVVAGGLVYIVICVFAGAVWLVWCAIPVFLIVRSIV